MFHWVSQNKHSINSPSPWHKSILHLINIYHLTQASIQNLLIQFKSMFQKLYSPIRVWIKGIPFLLNIGTNELNIHCSGNLSYDKILNMFVKDFKNLSPPALNDSITTPEGPLAFLIFIWFIAHFTSSTSILLTTPSTLLASML